MKSSKKLLVALLVFTMLLSTVSVGFAAEAEKLAPEVVRAKALGILKGDHTGNLNLDKPITRAEALALIVRISGLESSADLMKGVTQFPDVTDAHWASGYVNLGVGQNIVNGYPDGTFKPEGNVTYAEMVKMLLYAMNYGITVEGAPWPAGVMGKADDLGLFDDVNAAPNVPALRGDVVKMIDNSLTVKHLVQTGYGDLKQYVEGDHTFLSKLKVSELKDVRVTAVDVKKSRVTINKKAYDVLDDKVNIDSLLGVEVTAWANDDDEIFFIDPDWDAVRVDIVKADVAENDTKVKLKIEDKSYRLSDDIEIYVNGESEDEITALKAGLYGYFVLDEDDEIIVANLKDWDVAAGVVTEVDAKNNIISYFMANENEDEIDLDDEDEFIIILDGEKIDLEDVEENDVIYAVAYDDIYHVLVVRNSLVGEVEKVKDDKVTIDGKAYNVVAGTTYSTDEDKNIALLTDGNSIKDMVDEEAFAILDLAGDLRHITSDVKTTSDDIYGVVTKVDDYNEVVRIFADGSAKSYDVDGKIYEGNTKGSDDANKRTFAWLKGLTKIGSDDAYAIVRFSLNKDGEIADLFVLAQVKKDGSLVNNNNYAASLVSSRTITKFNDKHDTITASGTFFVTSDTRIIDEIDDMDEVKWDNIKDKDVPTAGVSALVVANNRNDVKLLIFAQNEYVKISGDTSILAVVLDKYYKGGDWKIKAAVHDDEETEYVLTGKSVAEIGEVIEFKLTSKDEIDTVTKYVYGDPIAFRTGVVNGKVTAKDGNYITVNSVDYRVDSLTLIYDVTDGLDDIEKASLSDVKANKTNVALVTEGRAVKVLYILGEDEVVEVRKTTVKDISINTTNTLQVDVELDIKKDDVVRLYLVKSDGTDDSYSSPYTAPADVKGHKLSVTATAGGTYTLEVVVNGKVIETESVRVR